jgi:hypothetical protein
MTRQNGEGLEGGSLGSKKRIDRVLAASTSYPILSYAAVPPGLTVYLCWFWAMKAKTESVLWEKAPWKGKEGGGGGGGVWH